MFDATPIDLGSLSELAVEDVRILWINDWYDGPIEAVAEYRGERCLMVVHDPDVITTALPWRWVLFSLTPSQREEEERWHRRFVEHVGAHWDCTGGPHPIASGDHEQFYGPHRERRPRSLAQHEAIGWIASVPGPKIPGGLLRE